MACRMTMHFRSGDSCTKYVDADRDDVARALTDTLAPRFMLDLLDGSKTVVCMDDLTWVTVEEDR